MAATDVAGYVACWQPVPVPPQAARFARSVVELAAPPTRARANVLLQSAARVAAYAVPPGLDPVPEVLLHPSVTGRFAGSAPGLSGSARRMLRTTLRFLARRVVPALAPADASLPRERAKAPCSPAEIDGYLALAGAQPTAARRMRAAGLACLGAGAGLTGADLRGVRGSDVACRSGGVVVDVHGARPRAVPVLSRYHDILLASAQFAGSGLVTGGASAVRKNITTPADPVAGRGDRAAPAGGQPAAGDLAGRLRPAARPGHVHARGRDHLLAAARRPARNPRPGR
jgi:integrase